MIVDIHTHSSTKSSYPAICNLTIVEAESFFSTTQKEFISTGIHPWYIDEFSTNLLGKIENWATDNRMLAIGECGLDKNAKSTIEVQLSVFEKHILIAEKVQKPMIIHCVGCFNELLELKKKINPKQLWIIHGFRGKPELATQILKSGCSLSFGEHFNEETVQITPIDKLYIETDESKIPISDIYTQIAEIKMINPQQLNAGEQFLQKMVFFTGR